MKVTLSWLKDHLDTEASLEDLCGALTQLGLVVDGVEDPGQKWRAFRVVDVCEVLPHPRADRLRVCLVNTGEARLQVVCGAENVRPGMKTVLALPGDLIPSTGQILKKGVIRGVESLGMLCSYEELGLDAKDFGASSVGIVDLGKDFSAGSSFVHVLGLTDPVIEIDVTPNRGDALGVRGLARDLAAAGWGTLKPLPDYPSLGLLPGSPLPEPSLEPPSLGSPLGGSSSLGPASGLQYEKSASVQVRITEEARPFCPLFGTCEVQTVQNRASPPWIQQRLKALGLNPLSALVDITNYLTYDLGRPLHVFDRDKIRGALEIHLSKGGEVFDGLNGKTYALPPGLLVISDEGGVISLAGIMGGASSACDLKTVNVLLECAFFTPEIVRKGGQGTGILSDARFRFERGVDPESVVPGLEAALPMVISCCGGRAGEIHLEGGLSQEKAVISLRLSALEKRGGLKVSSSKALDIFSKLGFSPVLKGGSLDVTVPSWRFDIEGDADLVEEVLRVVGYGEIPPVFPPFRPVFSALSPRQKQFLEVGRLLAARGFYEVVTWSFVSVEKALLFGGVGGGVDESLTLVNPISADLAVMRPSLLPGLLDLAVYHANRSLSFNPIFEVGPQYTGIKPEDQHKVVAALIPLKAEAYWQKRPGVDIFQGKAHLQAALEVCRVNLDSLQVDSESAPAWYHPARGCVLKQGPRELGFFGEIHPGLLKKFDLEGRFAGFEIFLDRLSSPRVPVPRPPLQLSPYQPVTRDLAFVLDQGVSCEKLLKALRKGAGKNLTGLYVFDVFTDEARLGLGKKSIAVRFTLQAQGGTLTDGEVTAVVQQMILEAARITGASLRGGEA